MNGPLPRDGAYGSSLAHLHDALARIATLLRAQLLRLRLAYPEAQRERYWHLTDEHLDAFIDDDTLSPLAAYEPSGSVQRLLDRGALRDAEIRQRVAATRGVELRLQRLQREFELAPEAVDALLLALLPSLHSTYRRLLGILQQDPARMHASAGLIAEVLATSAQDLRRLNTVLSPGGPLARQRLVALSGTDEEPLALRGVVAEERIVSYLLGGDALDARIDALVRLIDEPVELRALSLPAEALSRLEMLPNLRITDPQLMRQLRVSFCGPDAALAVQAFATVAQGLGLRLLVVDAQALLSTPLAWSTGIELALREARLLRAAPMFVGLEALAPLPDQAQHLAALMQRLSPFPHPAAVHTGLAADAGTPLQGTWLPFRLGMPGIALREQAWRRLLSEEDHAVEDPNTVVPQLARAFQFTGAQIHEAWRRAQGLARYRNIFLSNVEARDLQAACREVSATRLVAFARRLEPQPRVNVENDLVLPPRVKQLLRELRERVRHHAAVHAAMGLGEHMRQGRGVTALFIGSSGTGKTWAAQVLASELQLDLYCVDLAALVSKWVGETEKNLSQVFTDAERANCMLFFDEADALFGRRAEVKEAQDRWANLEVNFLLQRIEAFRGVVILASNLRQNMDDAFQRRIHVVAEFPAPDAAARLALWRLMLPRAPHLAVRPEELQEIAQRFEISGGNIRNVVLDACFRALAEGPGGPLTSRHLVAGIAREFQKLARPVTRTDFGRFCDWAMEDVVAPALAGSAGGG